MCSVIHKSISMCTKQNVYVFVHPAKLQLDVEFCLPFCVSPPAVVFSIKVTASIGMSVDNDLNLAIFGPKSTFLS